MRKIKISRICSSYLSPANGGLEKGREGMFIVAV